MNFKIPMIIGLLSIVAPFLNAPAATPAKPNVLIIYADDIGRGDLGVYGQEHFQTPNIDRLYSQGMRMDRFYGCTVCAPARAGLLTGNTNIHSTKPNQGGLEIQLASGFISQEEFDETIDKRRKDRPGRYFLGQMAQSSGYHTAYFGKLGVGYTETEEYIRGYGFDYHCGLYDSVICWGFYPEYYWENGKRIPIPTNPKFDHRYPACPLVGEENMVYSEDIWLEKCREYLTRQTESNQPFMAIYATQLPHGPASIAPKDYVYKDRKEWPEKERVYASMMAKLDTSVGSLLQHLEELGIADNTLVIFTGDNGHEPGTYLRIEDREPESVATGIWDARERGENRFNGTLGQRGIKRWNFEGGIDVPFLVRWPGRIQPGSSHGMRAAIQDVLPTLAEVMGVEIPVAIDGLSLLPALTGQGTQQKHEYLFWINTTGATGDTLIAGDWKLIYENVGPRDKTRKVEQKRKAALYKLDVDPFEEKDLSNEYPERVMEMKALMVKARQPLP